MKGRQHFENFHALKRVVQGEGGRRLRENEARLTRALARQRDAERLEMAMQAAGVGIHEIDLDSRQVCWDDRMKSLFGVPQDYSYTPSLEAITSLLHPSDRDGFRHSLDAIQRGDGTLLENESRVVHPGGDHHYLRFRGRASRFTPEGPLVLLGICWDVTAERELERQFSYQATHDALTGLCNRFEFERQLEEARHVARADGKTHVVCFMDLDHFKFINDTCGHAAGDALLQELALLMQQQVRASDVLARLGGDEFGLLLPACSLRQGAAIAEKLMKAVQEFCFRYEGRGFKVGISIGVAPLTRQSSSIDEAMSHADVSCYAAKNGGRNRVAIYEAEHGETGLRHHQLRLAADIREAIADNRFCLHAQPIASTRGNRGTSHHELLVRMLGPEGELIQPGTFIPAAEHYNLMQLVDRWVLSEALLHKAGAIAAVDGMKISLNLSAQSLNDESFLPFILALLERTPLAPGRLLFEITETAAVTHLEAATAILSKLRERGCAIALDDFGSGLSSFKYLTRLPMDYLKIDGSFIRRLNGNTMDRAVVESIHSLARRMGALTVAEFVEDGALLAIVRELGIDYAQGFEIGRPVPLEELVGPPGS